MKIDRKFFQNIRGSLFLRLIFIFGLTVILLMAIAAASLHSFRENRSDDDFGHNYVNQKMTLLINQIIDDIGTPPNSEKAKQITNALPINIIIKGPNYFWQSEELPRVLNRLKETRKINKTTTFVRNRWIRGLKMSKQGFDYYLLWKGHELNKKDYTILYTSLIAALIILFLNYWLVRRLFKPIGLLKDGAERISQGQLDYRVQTNRADELGELTTSINTMADSLQAMLEAKQQLLLAISHEIRSPITRAKVQLEFLENDKIKASLLEDINEVDFLVSQLLEAERLNSRHASLKKQTTAFAEFLKKTIEDNWPNHPNISLNLPEQDVEIAIDRLRMHLLLRNIIGNALHYGENQAVAIKLHIDNDELCLSVTDKGPGISAEHIPHLTEPFYRTDSARQKKTGGIGLGLYLCQLIANAHGGRIQIDSEPGTGTCVSVFLPL